MRLIRAFAAALATLALLVGVPVVLLRLVGNPITDLTALLSGDVTDQVVLSVLTVIACAAAVVAWVQFTVAFTVEFVSGIRRTPVPARIPLVSHGQQRLARALVTAVLLLGPTVLTAVGPTLTAAAGTGASPASTSRPALTAPVIWGPEFAAFRTDPSSAPSGTDAAPSDTAPAVAAVPTRPVIIVSDGPRTWWDLAEQYLGGGDQWHTLWDLNQGRTQSDGTVLTTSTALLRTGWNVAIPDTAFTGPDTGVTTEDLGVTTDDGGVITAGQKLAPAVRPVESVVVGPGDSLSAIGAAHGGVDWTVLWQLNQHRPEPDDEQFIDPDDLRPGWVIAVPSMVTPTGDVQHNGGMVTVSAGDTLSGLAAHLGVSTQSVWDLNRNKVQPDGKILTNPHHIEPGWVLTLPDPDALAEAVSPGGDVAITDDGPPATPAGPSLDGPTTPAVADPGGAVSNPKPSPPDPTATDTSPDGTPPAASSNANVSRPGRLPEPTDQAPPTDQPLPTAPTPATTVPAPAAPSLPVSAPADAPIPTGKTAAGATSAAVNGGAGGNSAEPAGEAADSAEEPGVVTMLAAGGGAVLLTGLGLLAWMRARRRQFRVRRPGRAIPATPAGAAEMERLVQSAGRRGFADVTWLDQTLRSLVHTLSRQPAAELPDVIAARVGSDDIELILATPNRPAPTPWSATEEGDRWVVRRADPLAYDDADRDALMPPFPLLVSVGYTPDGDHYLLDLERVGSVRLTGDRVRCFNLARYIAAEVSLNTWSELLQVTMVGFGQEMVDLCPSQLTTTTDLAGLTAAVRSHLSGVRHVMAETGVDVAAGRLRTIAGDTWAPHLILITETADHGGVIADLLTQVNSARQPIAVVIVTDTGAGPATRWTLEIDDLGVLTVPELGVRLIAEQLPADEAAPLSQLLAAANLETDEPVREAVSDGSWEQLADTAGNLRAGLTAAADQPVLKLAGTWPGRANSILPLSPAVYADLAATTEEDVVALAPGMSDEVRDRLAGADPDLDADLRAWWDPDSERIKLRLLGPVDLWGARLEPAPVGKPQKVEAVAYLATRDHGAAASQARADLWPADQSDRSVSKVRNLMLGCRRWLGINPITGTEHIPPNPGENRGGVYTVEGLLIDVDLFRRLRLRALSRGPAGISDLRSALDLVTGVPFEAHRPHGYGWTSELVSHYIGMIADTAHIVATHHLANNQPEPATTAAQVALKAGSTADNVLLDLVAACHARGDQQGGDAYVQRIMTNWGADVEEDIPARTYSILLRRGWLPRQTA